DTGSAVLSLTVQGIDADSIDETVLLEAGSYEQEFFAQAGVFTTSGDAGPSSAWYSGSLTVLDPPCNAADIAAPFGVLDLADIQAFVSAFVNLGPAADIAEPFGVWDLLDVQLFIVEFAVAGCP
ncbi:MAG: hypothetical protein K8E66_12570, partial [Phycisphaerales bacterium]|nr:hypothetical protein [Phycisphaerales bacterium]